MTIEQIDQMIAETTARLRTLKKIRRIRLKERTLAAELEK